PAVAERIRFRSRGFRRLGSGDRTHESTPVTRRLVRVHIHPIRRLRTRRGRSPSPPLARPANPRAWNKGRSEGSQSDPKVHKVHRVRGFLGTPPIRFFLSFQQLEVRGCIALYISDGVLPTRARRRRT